MPDVEFIHFDHLKSNLSDFIVVDVRSREEVVKDGQIPGSHSIPIVELESALQMKEAAFQTKFGFPKPSADAPIVTHCHLGARAEKAAMAFKENGFTQVKCYKGSLNDWLANGGDVIQPEPEFVEFDVLKSSLSDVTLVDVRGKDEIIKDGQIPGSHSIPVDEVDSAMELGEQDFQTKYGFPKPSTDAPLVTHCKIGGRAQKAAVALWQKGFTNVKCYKGSLNDWLSNGGDVIKPGKPFES